MFNVHYFFQLLHTTAILGHTSEIYTTLCYELFCTFLWQSTATKNSQYIYSTVYIQYIEVKDEDSGGLIHLYN